MQKIAKSEKGVLKYWTEAFKTDHMCEDSYELESSVNLISPQCVLDNLMNKDWRKIRKGCEQISTYTKNNPSRIGDIKVDALNIVLYHVNKPSVITRNAAHSLRDMVFSIENFTDEEWKQIVSTLLTYYSTASSKQLTDLAEETLKYIVNKIPYRTSALILTSTSEKLKHKKSIELAAKLLKKVVVELGPYNILTGNNILGSNILNTAAKYLTLQSDATRHYGKKILYSLMMSQDFENVLAKHVPISLQHVTNNAVKDIKTKGVQQKFKQSRGSTEQEYKR